MRNRDDKDMNNIDRSEVKETTRRPGSSYDSSPGKKNSDSERMRDENDLSRDSESGPPKDRHF